MAAAAMAAAAAAVAFPPPERIYASHPNNCILLVAFRAAVGEQAARPQNPCSPTSRHSGWSSSCAARALPKPTIATKQKKAVAAGFGRSNAAAAHAASLEAGGRVLGSRLVFRRLINTASDMLKLAAALLLACAAAARAQTAAQAPPALESQRVSRLHPGEAGRAPPLPPPAAAAVEGRRAPVAASAFACRPCLLTSPHPPLRRWSCARLWRWTRAFRSTF